MPSVPLVMSGDSGGGRRLSHDEILMTGGPGQRYRSLRGHRSAIIQRDSSRAYKVSGGSRHRSIPLSQNPWARGPNKERLEGRGSGPQDALELTVKLKALKA